MVFSALCYYNNINYNDNTFSIVTSFDVWFQNIDSEKPAFPTTLKGFGYAFNSGEFYCACIKYFFCKRFCILFTCDSFLLVAALRFFSIDPLVLLLNCILEGKLRHVDTDEPFNFEVKPGDKTYNQKHYEALGEVS